MTNAQDVLDFWFADDSAVRWFVRDAEFDAQIRERFGATLEAAARGELDRWAATPRGWLALLIVLDQFSRNIHRNDARAWAQDPKAQALALAGIERGDDERLAPLERIFAYLPLEHAEDLSLQQRSVALFRALASHVPARERGQYDNFLDYAQRHCEVITRYGRFPHRNAALGRADTADEREYLAQPGSGF
ncbi:hypothetical protein ASG87_10445 [Frateuria sp. Soil773]|uniref:DUF924 family protein n=1 Tax=Frateuria sp. Soil773 TaxID=1736407 RepID=UPI0006F5F0F8|nr:DUF924 family protein [Frateuria sp. Soil773]KRF01916.1 hypothetical protein ASG87_10445 [Frateuria sp. Soil773]